MFRLLLLAGAILPAVPFGARAENEFSRVEGFAGYSFVRQTVNPNALTGPGTQGVNFNGGSGQVALNFNNWFGAVADIGGYATNSTLTSIFPISHPASATINTNIVSYLFGPKIAYGGPSKFRPFAEILFGCARIADSPYLVGRSDNAFATVVGGGVDYGFTESVAVRLGEVDYLMTTFKDFANDRQDNLRVSVGIVVRLGH